MADSLVVSLVPEFERLAKQRRREFRIPGIALGIVRNQELAWFGGFGCADLDSGDAPHPDSLVRVASVTKTFTTAAILQLRDLELLNLDDPLLVHIPEFQRVRARAGRLEDVTLRRLLTHRSGLMSEPATPGWDALDFPSRGDILEALRQTEVVIPQDSAWKYSNLAFALLGEVVQRLGKQAYPEYIREHILDPLGMTSTAYDLNDSLRDRLMSGYNASPYSDGPEKAPYAHLKGLAAAGQLQSSVRDLAKWVGFQFQTEGGERRGAQVLSGRTLAEFHRPQYIEPDWQSGQCLGWRATRVGNHVYHSHGGGIHGFSTQVVFNMPARTGAILFMNMWPPPGGQDLVQEVLELILNSESGDDASTGSPDLQPTPRELRRFLGFYRADPGIEVEIVFREGELRLAVPAHRAYSLHAPAALEATDRETEWVVRGGRGAGERAVFTFGPTGRVLRYELGAFVFCRYDTAGKV